MKDLIFDIQRFKIIDNANYPKSNTLISGTDGNDRIENNGSNVTIYGGDGNDNIYDSFLATKSSINAGLGDDTISLLGSYTKIQYTTGDGNDTIYGINYYDTLQISGAEYTTTKSGDDLIIKVGTGSISVVGGANVAFTIDGTLETSVEGVKISNSTRGAVVNGTSGNDSIYNSSSYANINALEGDDYISNYGAGAGTVKINAGEDNDTISNYSAHYVTINGGDGNDSVKNDNGHYLNINTGNGDDTVYNGVGSRTTISAGDGNDSIVNSYSSYVSISGGAGIDTIMIDDWKSSYVTINAGADSDIISLRNGAKHTKIQYANGDGNDTIIGFDSNDTIQITSGTYSTMKSGNNFIISVGNGSLVLKDLLSDTNKKVYIQDSTGAVKVYNDWSVLSGTDEDDFLFNTGCSDSISILGYGGNDLIENNVGDNVTVVAGNGNDTIYNYRTNRVFIDAGAGDDLIQNPYDNFNTTINGGDGNDNINNSSASSITIDGGAGDDSIYSYDGSNVKMYGGAGNDNLAVSGYYGITLNGGTGDDSIRIYNTDGGQFIQYANGDGNDTVFGMRAKDTLQITGGTYATTKSGDDLIIGVGTGSISVVGGANIDFAINGTLSSGGSDTTPPDTTPPDTTPAETLPNGWKYASDAKTSMTATLATADNLDLTENYGVGVIKIDGAKTTGGVKIIGNDLSNSIKGGKGADTISGGKGNDTVSLGAGADVYIYYGGNDLIQDYATTDAIHFDTKINNASLNGSNLIITTDAGNVTIKNGKDKKVAVKDTTKIFTILNEYPTVEPDTLPAGWKFGSSIVTASVTIGADDLDLSEEYGEKIKKVDASKLTNGVEIVGNDLGNSVKGSKGADVIKSGAGNDTVSLGGGNDTYIYTGGNDLIQDYVAGQDVIKFETSIENASVNGSNLVIATAEGNITVKSAKGKVVTVIDDNDEEILILDEYPIEETPLPDGWKYGTASKTNNDIKILTATTAAAESALDLTESYGNGVLKVDASKISGAFLTGNDLNNSIKGGTGDDEIDGGAGNDTLTGGKGDDYFIYSGGDDLITDYGTGADLIQINTDEIEINSIEIAGINLVIKTSEGELTVKNGSKKVVTVIDNGGNILYPKEEFPNGWKYDSAKKLLQASVASADNEIDLTEWYGDGVEKVDGSKISGGVVITGNDLENSLKGGKGGDTLDGGEGNDTLTGGSGDDVFVYSGGDDVITDYVAGHDSIQVAFDYVEGITADTVGADVIYYTEGGTIKVAKGNGKEIILMDENGDTIDIGGGDPPNGWQLDAAKHILKSTIAIADNEIDLNEGYGKDVTKVDGSKISGGVEIIGNNLNNSLKGGKGNDVLDGGAGNDTLTSGAGDDVFVYSGGDDVFTDYTVGKDSIMVAIDDLSGMEVETVGTDVIYYTAEGTFKVTKGKDKEITLMDENEKVIVIGGSKIPDGWKYDATKKLLQASVASADNEIDLTEGYGKDVTKVDGSKISGGVEIYGNDLDNSIKGGKGNDILDGGAGNDTMTGGAGADTYVYSGGDDLINDYATVDAVQFDLSNIAITKVATVSSNVKITTEQGTLTIKNAKTKTISFIDENGENFTPNGYSKKVAENLWFMEDNFGNGDLNSICENKFAVTEIQTQNYNPEQNQNVLTFADDK